MPRTKSNLWLKAAALAALSFLLIAALAVPARAAISLSDNFNDNSLDGAKWQPYAGEPLLIEQNERLENNLLPGTFMAVETVNSYSRGGAIFQAEAWANVQEPGATTAFFLSVLRIQGSGSGRDGLIYFSGDWYYRVNNSSYTNFDVDPPTYHQNRKYLLGVGYSADGNTVYFYIDGTLVKTVSSGVAAGNGYIYLASTHSGRFDNAVVMAAAEPEQPSQAVLRVDNSAGGAISGHPVGLWLPADFPWAEIHSPTGDEDRHFAGKDLRIFDGEAEVPYALVLLPDIASQKGWLWFPATVGAGSVKDYTIQWGNSAVWPRSWPWAVFDAWEDFETIATGLFRNLSLTDYGSIVSSPLAQGEKAYKWKDTSGSTSGARYPPSNTIWKNTDETIIFLWRPEEAGAEKFYGISLAKSGYVKAPVRHYLGDWAYYDGELHTLGAVVSGQWYIHEVRLRHSAGKYDWYIYNSDRTLLFSAENVSMAAIATDVSDFFATSGDPYTNEDYLDSIYSFPYLANQPTVTYISGGHRLINFGLQHNPLLRWVH